MANSRITWSAFFSWRNERVLFLQASSILLSRPWKTLIIEKQFQKHSFSNTEGIIRAKHGWVFAAHSLRSDEWTLLEVAPSTWQSRVLNIGREERDTLGAYTRYAASHETGKLIQSPDEASAICIAMWALGRKI